MNELLDDETVIARLRSALDELTAPDAVATPGDELPRLSRTMTPARWMAVAAATVLVIGAVAAVAVNRSNRSDVASTPTTVPPTVPATTLTPTETTLIRVETKWFTIISPDLVAGERTAEQCCRASLPGPLLVMAWSRTGADAAFLTLTEYRPEGRIDWDDDATVRQVEGADLSFHSIGLSDEEREGLADAVVLGSGLPYVLPVEGWGLAAMGQTAGEGRLVQMYTPSTTDPVSSYLPTVTMSAGEYRGELDLLGLWPDGQPVTVAGYEGWKVTEAEGHVTVFWETGDGNWATLRIDAQLADRTDGLIAAVVEVDPTEPTVDTVLVPTTGGVNSETQATIVGDPLPAFDGAAGNDPAVGLPAPAVDGFDYEGNEIRIDPTEGPHLVMFQAHWCPHCAANLPDIQQWMADGTIPDWLQLTLVSTAEAPEGDNYPAEKWLQELGWTGRVLEDAPQGTSGAAGSAGVAYGATGWPYFVVIGVDGNVLARASGELSVADMEELLAGLPDAP